MKVIDYDEVFYPVVRLETLRFLFTYATVNDLELQQVDVKTAFLYSELDEEIFMDTPELPEKVLRTLAGDRNTTFGNVDDAE